MADRPTVLELLEAVREFLERDVVPALSDPRLRYHALIAVNVLRIAEREVPGHDARLRAELAALEDLLGRRPETAPGDPARLADRVEQAARDLCERIRRGEADQGAWRDRVLAHVRAAVEERLRINNPRALG